MKLRISLFVVVLVLVTSFAWAESPAKNFVKLAVKERIQAKVAERMRSARPEFKYFTPDKVVIDRIEPVQVTISGHPATFYAVSLRLTPPTGTDAAAKPMSLIVDESCDLVVGDISDLATGKSLFQDALDRVSAVSLSSDFGHDILSGTGTHELVMVSDPYCPFCRRAWEYLLGDGVKSRIKRMRLAHMPLVGLHPGADTACKFMLLAAKTGLSAFDVADFAYRGLQPPKSQNTALDVANQFLARFPELKKRFKTAEAAVKALDETNAVLARDTQVAQEMGITGTPAVFVDGVQVRGGFDQARISELLAR